MRVFVDTNVLVFANQKTSPSHSQAIKSLESLEARGDELWISRQVLREYLVVVTRPGGLASPLATADAIRRIRDFTTMFRIVEDGPEVTEHLCTLMQSANVAGKRIHDVNIVATMLAGGIPTLLTDNGSDFAPFRTMIEVMPLLP